jgi:signal transduction histidine kinase
LRRIFGSGTLARRKGICGVESLNTERIRKILEKVIEDRDYSLRIDQSEDDPLIELINTVLQETEKRGEKIELHKKSLQDQVAVRTADLEKSLQQLALDKREAETSSLSKSFFLANLSHELRTPLNHIIGYSEMIQEELEDAGLDDLVADVSKIRKASDDLVKWVEEIIDLSKIESGHSELEHQLFSVTDLVSEAAEKARSQAEKSGNTLTVDLADSLGELNGDRDRVERVLFNLLQNACRVTENGKISLKVSREAVGETDWLTFVVQDSGAGVSPKILENLFKGYTEADETLSSGFGADALMLAITHRLVLVMGGNLNGESELGAGSTFTLRLPADMKSHLEKPHVVKASNLFIRDILTTRRGAS